MKSVKLFVFPLLLLVIIFSGCLETPVADPPHIDENILEECGWVQLGDSTSMPKTFDMGGKEIKINTATINYADKSLEEYLMRQVGAYSSVENVSTSRIVATRVVLPAGIPLPSQIVLEMASTQVKDMAAKMDIKDFHKINTTQVPLKNGKTAEAKVYSGYITLDGNNVPLKGMIATWSVSGSTLVVIVVYPDEDFVFKAGTKKVIISIDGKAEYEEIVKLLQHVE
ncbi:MAG: hypothetical protein EMLJLAPB_00178 [Candidatus Argoarchaeum ethanivorans]|uniref:Uncharacterized protein n=1 Tax=Candidatus Argoarchaeum ethanivorans TaxID=2608793 RepID=A0A811T7U8_9EURY|nr:MAG: hypothetical protein EMLJLAPB_00178 [Candidatus Argoarchaeum ethanivorans]